MESEASNLTASSPLEIELYKSLRAEAGVCIEKVTSLRVQKLTLIGGMLAFLLAHYWDKNFSLDKLHDPIAQAALCAIPTLAILLDIQICEFSVQARAISRFLCGEFATANMPTAIRKWEGLVWGIRFGNQYSGEDYDQALIHIRSFMTVLGTALPTIVTIILTAIVLHGINAQYEPWIWGVASVVSVAYAGVTWFVWQKVWPPNNGYSKPSSPLSQTNP